MFGKFIFVSRKPKGTGPDSASSNLVSSLSKDDPADIEGLYNLYFDRIYSLVYNQVGRNHVSAEEVVQETWLAVIKSATKFKGKSSLYTWICSIAHHKISDYQRRSYRDDVMGQKPSANPEIPELQLVDSGPLSEEIIEKEETKWVVRRALGSLPSHYQQVLTLKYIEEMSAKEVSQVIGKSIKSVESLLSRAKLALLNEIVDMSK
jgi:RNA polymerase sigma-70 factor, ECF subfamily